MSGSMHGRSSSNRTMRIDIDPSTIIPAKPPAVPVSKPPQPKRSKTPIHDILQEVFHPSRAARTNRNTPYDKLLSSIYDAVLITDGKGRVLDCNQRAQEFFVADETTLLGVNVLDVISGADPSLLGAIYHNLDEHKYTVIEATCNRLNGTGFPAEIAVNKIELDSDGQLCFLIRDISVRQKAQNDLKHALERMEALSRARMEFVSNVSHELRTPLTSMIYAVKNMERGITGPLPDRALQYLARLDADCQRLLSTVNDILDLRQIENNTLTLVKTRVPFTRLIENILDTLRIQAEQKHISLIFNKSDFACFVLCDPSKMERVVFNIIGNAIKFTPADGSITVAVAPSSDIQQQVIFTVSDTGIGIPRESLAKVTARYYQVGDQPRGTGLGLSITKELVELHGGKLLIESPDPTTRIGTRVTVSLPLIDAPSILAITSDKELENRLDLICASHGLGYSSLSSGHEALKKCYGTPPDLVVLGESSDDLSPSEILLQLRNNRKTSRMPALFLPVTPPDPKIQTVLKAFHVPASEPKATDAQISSLILGVFLSLNNIRGV